MERDIQDSIIVVTSCDVDWYRNNVGAYDANPECPHCHRRKQSGGPRWIRFGIGGKGGSDLIGILRRSGRLIACEVKRPGQTPRQDQEDFLARVSASGGISLCASSAEMVVDLVSTIP